ncbi:MAG: thioredoxin domain-containing protein [Nanoarchaeota archaeon]|nr:thioredoxin domain-containing protein [Nanoarchaeota archaeon]
MVKKKIKSKSNVHKKHKTNSNSENVKHDLNEGKKSHKTNNLNKMLVMSFVLLIVVIGIIMIFSDKEKMYQAEGNENINDNLVSKQDNNKQNANNNLIEINGNTELSNANKGNNVVLTIIEDLNCEFCQAKSFGEKIKLNLIPDLKIQSISYDSEEGKKILNELNAKQVPVYLFNKNIENINSWETQLAGVFEKVSINGETYYSLRSNFIPNKILNEEIPILDSAVVIGSDDAKVTIYEFSNYACHGCALAYGNKEILEQYLDRNPKYEEPMSAVFAEYIDTGLVKYVNYNVPNEVLNPGSTVAHLAALCADEQNKWREYHLNLFESRNEWVLADDKNSKMKAFAKKLGLDTNKFNTCLDSKKYQKQINDEIKLSNEYEITGTPTFYVGRNFLSGPQDYRMFKLLIDSEFNR